MDLAPGSRVGPYRLERLIGRGGMGEVYLATDERLDRPVALKFLPLELASDTAFRARFLGESRIAASLDHPHIVPIYEAGERDGLLFIAMRYVAGVDLGTLVKRDGPLGFERAVRILRGIADALDAAHMRGLVHRDVKPGNILVMGSAESREHAYLADFGLVKHLGSGADFTQAGQILGSLGYIAPEQIEGRPIDARADVYSLACVSYEVLSGRPPFVHEHDVANLWAHLQAPRPRISELVPELAWLDSVLERGMAIEPADRFASAGRFLRALEGVRQHEPNAAATAEQDAGRVGGHGSPQRERARRRRRGILVGGLVAVPVGAAIIGSLISQGGILNAEPTQQPSVQVLVSPSGTEITEAPSPSVSLGADEVTILRLEGPPDAPASFQSMSDQLTPGTRYEMAITRPTTRFTIPGPGWYADRDFVDGFNLVREALSVEPGRSAFPDYFTVGVVQVVFEGPCDHSPRRAIQQTPPALIEFLTSHPSVEASDPVPINFGQYSGLSTELTVEAPPPEGTCELPEELEGPVVERFKKRTYLFLFGEDVFHISPEERIKVVAVNVDGRLLVLMYGTIEPERWTTFSLVADQLLSSVEFLP